MIAIRVNTFHKNINSVFGKSSPENLKCMQLKTLLSNLLIRTVGITLHADRDPIVHRSK
jgi:hypothetical protein